MCHRSQHMITITGCANRQEMLAWLLGAKVLFREPGQEQRSLFGLFGLFMIYITCIAKLSCSPGSDVFRVSTPSCSTV